MNILVLGGTTEASALARRLAGDGRFAAVLSLAGVTRAPAAAAIPQRVGGFGGAAGLAAYLRDERVAALVDATHPFAARISTNAADAAAAVGIPRLIVCRPPWHPGPGDRWTRVADMDTAAEALGRAARRVLLTIGRRDLAPFAARPWHHYVVRSVEQPGEAAPSGARILTARGPFDPQAELALLEALEIEVIVTKNSGGTATAGKLLAARRIGIPVVMVDRPPVKLGEVVADADAAWDWLEQRHAVLAPRGV